MPTGIFYDLPEAETEIQQIGPIVVGFDREVLAKYITRRVTCTAASFDYDAFGTAAPSPYTSYFLVEETAPEDVGGGMVEWNQVYYQVPPNRSEFEAMSYNYTLQFVKDADTGIWISSFEGFPFALTVSTRLDFSYIKTNSPSSISIDQGWRIFKAGAAMCETGSTPISGTLPSITVSSPYLGEDSQIRRWKGNIWEKRNRYIPYPEINVQYITT